MAHIEIKSPVTQTLFLCVELWVRVMTKLRVEIFAAYSAQIYSNCEAYWACSCIQPLLNSDLEQFLTFS